MVRWLQSKFALWGAASAAPIQAELFLPLSTPSDLAALEPAHTAHRYRTIFVSDVHLGTRGCKAGYLLDFLRHNESDTLYLVGDIIDGWALRKTF